MLEDGSLSMDGSTSEVIEYYQNKGVRTLSYKSWETDGPGDNVGRLIGVGTKNVKGELSDIFDVHDLIII